MAVSFTELFNSRLRGDITSGAPTSPKVQGSQWGDLYQNTMADYERLNRPMGGAASAPVSQRAARTSSLTPPSMSIGGGARESSSSRSTTPGSGTGDGIIPPYDTAKVESLAQRFAAPGVRRLRSALQDVQQGYYENPNVKRMTLRDALSGYGQGLESTMAGALRSGADIYNQEYTAKVGGAMQNQRIKSAESMQSNQISSNERIAQNNHEWQAYLSSLS